VRPEPVGQAPVVQRRHDLADQAVALRDLADLRQPLEHHRVGAAQPELGRQHQPGGTAADDHDIGGDRRAWRRHARHSGRLLPKEQICFIGKIYLG
jgi:hypothetical protein